MRRTILITALLSLLFSGSPIIAQEKHPAASSTPAFDQLKSLAGEWEGKGAGGEAAKLTYRVVSNGSAVMEQLQPAKEPEMITMYTIDGSRIVVTHYCSAGNQPTMQTVPAAAATGKYDFSFVRVSGTKTPDEGHMAGLSLSIADKDHLTQKWTFEDHGKSTVATFTFTRAK